MIDSTEEFRRVRSRYETFSAEIETILKKSLDGEGIKYQSIEGRAKEIESFEKKAKRKKKDGSLKYTDPMREIMDLAGVRIILYTLDDVKRTCKFIEPLFDILEKKDLGEEREAAGDFGYQSIHYLANLTAGRLALPDYSLFRDLICEIQVRTVLQHAWAEIEHDVQYKSEADLPRSIKTQLRSLAGLLEIGDREFQAIQDTDLQLKAAVRDDLQEELTRTTLSQSGGESTETEQALNNVRELVSRHQYHEAIQEYTKRIDLTPRGHTLYIGRAKARFLVGDLSGALRDLDDAQRLSPDDETVSRVRNQIKEGYVTQIPAPTTGPYRELTERGHLELEAGNGRAAYDYYSQAEEEGASKPFSRFNKSMACVAASDFDGAKLQLSSLKLHAGRPMEINIIALQTILAWLEKSSEAEQATQTLKEKLIGFDFSISYSPLRHLEPALKRLSADMESNNGVESVFAILRGPEFTDGRGSSDMSPVVSEPIG